MLVALTTDPLGFFIGIGNAVLHPVDTLNYMWGAVETAWERDVVNGWDNSDFVKYIEEPGEYRSLTVIYLALSES